MEATPPENTVSLYREEPEDFPVLRAFQQYIDAEQEKARKRMLSLSIFFGFLMTVVIVFFLVLMNNATLRNQLLNDRLVEYAMKDRERQTIVQPQIDNSAILALSAKIDEIQKTMAESQKKAEEIEQARQKAAKQAEAREQENREAQAKAESERQTKESLEIERLKALLAAEREKNSEEAKRRREEELEAYRRKHYPEYYAAETEKTAPQTPAVTTPVQAPAPVEEDLEDDEEEDSEEDPIEALLKDLSKDGSLEDNDGKAINYFTEEADSTAKKKAYTVPVDVKGSRGKWRIPNE